MADKQPSGAFILVRGVVQGVGFRPFIYSLALRHHLKGWVRNTSSGVEIQASGSDDELEAFIAAIAREKPPLAQIDSLEVTAAEPGSEQDFEIRTSQAVEGQFIPVSPDMCICEDCRKELFDPANRRYRYPFINCTNCGPRFTIVTDIPYDRPKTTMAGFVFCPECHREYDDPLDRRFHAQPVACPTCGPQISFIAEGKEIAARENALQTARRWLKEGKIIAVKGLGGYHLACDPANPEAVEALRKRKKRSDKPFALMGFDLKTVARHCQVSRKEKDLLESLERPVVLLERRPESPICGAVAPYQHTLGFMLAYTPLHLLLLEPEGGLDALVMTSGNLSEEPIAYREEEAFERLAGVADGFLTHNRAIHMRVDDSVVREMGGERAFIRRSRGFAPNPIRLPFPLPPILATGAELKNTFCLTRENYAFLSHHIGDMENYETLKSFEEGIAHYEKLFRIKPRYIACDLHPDYLATRYARTRAGQEGLRLIQVQHHHAHLAACLADNGWFSHEPVIELSYDGTGYGTDGAIWGGEILTGGYSKFERAFHLKYIPLPGGDSAIRNPARIALAHLWQAGLEWEPELPPVRAVCESDRTILHGMLEKHINSPSTSSMGRLFDAASSLVGVRHLATYEGQAAIELEALADPGELSFYHFDLKDDLIDPAPVWQEMIEDWRKGEPRPLIAARFHNAVAQVSLQACLALREWDGLNTVALSGGVWQNKYLYERTIRLLMDNGFQVLTHHQVPANDGGLALGQALAAAASLLVQA